MKHLGFCGWKFPRISSEFPYMQATWRGRGAWCDTGGMRQHPGGGWLEIISGGGWRGRVPQNEPRQRLGAHSKEEGVGGCGSGFIGMSHDSYSHPETQFTLQTILDAGWDPSASPDKQVRTKTASQLLFIAAAVMKVAEMCDSAASSDQYHMWRETSCICRNHRTVYKRWT